MSSIELIIKIDEGQYKFIRQSMTMDKVKDYPALLYDICEHIKTGTPLNALRDKIEQKIVKRPGLNHTRAERERNEAFLDVLDIIDKYSKEQEE